MIHKIVLWHQQIEIDCTLSQVEWCLLFDSVQSNYAVIFFLRCQVHELFCFVEGVGSIKELVLLQTTNNQQPTTNKPTSQQTPIFSDSFTYICVLPHFLKFLNVHLVVLDEQEHRR
jgi:hypothetical protein